MDTCPICHQPGDRPHDALLHARHDEQAADGYVACGCDPSEHDATGPCDRGEGHVGICCVEVDGQLVAFVCRGDDSEPHELVAVRAVD